MDWNDERIEALAKLWREGLSASQVARQLGGVSRSAVIGKVHRLGIAGRDTPSRPQTLVGRPRPAGPAPAPAAPARRPPRAPRAGPAAARAVRGDRHRHHPHADVAWLPLADRRARPGGFGFCGRLRNGAGSYCEGHAPMSVRRRETSMKPKEIDRMVVASPTAARPTARAPKSPFARSPENPSLRESPAMTAPVLEKLQVLVTGVDAAIARDVARLVAGEGASVLAADRDPATLSRLERDLGLYRTRIETAAVDLASQAEVRLWESALAAFGRLPHVMICCCGSPARRPTRDAAASAAAGLAGPATPTT